MAVYNPQSEHDVKKARVRLEQLIKKGKPFELTDIAKRSLKKNAYLHVLLSYLALELGYKMSYVKLQIWKMTWCRDMFWIDVTNEKTGEIYKEVRSSADLSEEEMAHAIGILIEKANSECNVQFPDRNSPTFDNDFIMMQKEIYQNEKHLK